MEKLKSLPHFGTSPGNMGSVVTPPEPAPSRRLKFVRGQDIVWLLLFSAMAAASPVRSAPGLIFLAAIAIFQLVEPRIDYFSSRSGGYTSIAIKLILAYLVIGYTDAINSSYYPILLLPVVSAATSLGPLATAVFTILACVSYLSFLLFLDWTDWARYLLDWRELFLRLIFLPVVGYLTYTMAKANREQARKYQAAAEQLAEANVHLQEAEAAMRRSDRLAALGQLTAGLAHELRNPLGTIRASAEMLRGKVGTDEVGKELAGFITSETDRANSLVTRFLDFARPIPVKLARTNLNEVLDSAVAHLDRVQTNVSVYKNYSPDIPPFQMDGELMERVVYNLLLNAVQASPSGAAVTIKTKSLSDGVEIAIIDRGSGIDPKHLESIFNPFFTTKPDGVGLGLPIVAKIIDDHGGTINVESEPGRGSIFRIVLPVRSSD